jgi:Spy/CpxP family protein refolding chaperone
MKKMNKTGLLIGIIIILVATNLATIISGIIHSSKIRRAENIKIEVPFNKRADFFHEQLGLTPEQRNYFMDFNREFNHNARAITKQMNSLRYWMIKEMAESNPDKSKLNEICANIGALHSQLKGSTVDYYLKMKGVCNKQQQEQLNILFERMLNSDGNIDMMRQGFGRQNRGMGRGRQNQNKPMFN